MGKVTGFMEYERIEEGYKPVVERLKNYKEFVIGLDDVNGHLGQTQFFEFVFKVQ